MKRIIRLTESDLTRLVRQIINESVIITDEDYPLTDDPNEFGKWELEQIFEKASSIDEANEMIEEYYPDYPGYYFDGKTIPGGGVSVTFYSPEGDEITGKYFPHGLGGAESLRNLERFRNSDDAFYNPYKRY